MWSLPTIAPRADASLWPSLRNPHQTFDTEQLASPSHPHRRQHNASHGAAARSVFTQLALEENKQAQRLGNIRNFGASWIRPPGIHKTYQAMIDEEKELREQEAIAAREQHLLDLAAAQQDAANADAREANGEEMENEERDLDEEIPEAEGSESEVSASESGSENDGTEEEESRAEVTFNEDSFIEGSMIEGRVGQMLAMEEASMEGSLLEERDLDDDVPEAGEYEHTDSSLMDSSDEDDGSFVQPGSRRTSGMSRRTSGTARSTRSRRSTGVRSVRRSSGIAQAHTHTHTVAPANALGQLQARGQIQNSRMSLELEGSSSFLEGSSFLRSSPAAARGNLRARLFGARSQR
ncbi:hypothetical protein BU23DRAFT_603932 [Bimuria novae-zelandiae CBS 107.79]|uniref:Uncharacterized protein n=1 Tax=Bimuria novae-zelandiae CBS 107.79 TaxID=1447943 RepID=A0A6A5UQ16_9PLEO|nr:hypothetical protein BU23DRAFT_603932 [Bimuria novae-zelandiae CBS 107.79]